SYAEVIKGPARRLEETKRVLRIEEALVTELLTDIDAGGTKDSLPLLAFTLERLYGEYYASGTLKLSHYNELGRVRGSTETAVELSLNAADPDPPTPRNRAARLKLLRRSLIPWLAGIDPDTGGLRRRVARQSEIPAEARPLIQHLVEQRLLATDVNKETDEATIEPAHEALLRQWGELQGWLTEDAGLLAVLDGVQRASRDWDANSRDRAWLTHATDRLAAAERLSARPDLAAKLERTDQAYIADCRRAETDTKRRRQLQRGAIYALMAGITVGLLGWTNQSYVADKWHYLTVTRPHQRVNVRPHVLSLAEEQALRPKQTFRECASDQGKDYCPEMVVVPAGSFDMGSPPTEKGRYPSEDPLHRVTIGKPFAVAKFALTFDEWDTCVTYGDCPRVSDNGWGRRQRPVINVTWGEAQHYVAWLSKMTGRPYRLLTEAEYEYATRAGTQTAYPWGDDIGKNNATCLNCGSNW